MGVFSSSALALATLFSFHPIEPIAAERVDLVEVNHFYDENGKHVLDQLIFYDWSDEKSEYEIRAWRLLKKPSQRPLKDFQRNEYSVTWQDGDTLRRIQAEAMSETWTQYDPELVARASLPKDQRRELLKKRMRR